MMSTSLTRRIAAVVCSLALLYPAAGWAMDIFVTVPPQQWVIENIVKERGDVHVLVKNGQDPHTFEPTPKQIVALSRAKVWFTVDLPFEVQLKKKISQVAPELQIVDMAEGIEKVALADEHGHGHNHDDHDDQHGDGEQDPHVWLSPANLSQMAMTTAKVLGDQDPANKDFYEQNLHSVTKRLADLHGQIEQQLAPYNGSSFYVFHPSFGYFAREYGLHQEAVEVGGKSPGPRQIATLVTQAKKDQVKVVFVQPQFDRKSAETIAAAIDGQVVSLDALAEDVITNLTVMADKIEQALADGGRP